MVSFKNDFCVAFVKFHLKSQSVGVVVLAVLTASFFVGSSTSFLSTQYFPSLVNFYFIYVCPLFCISEFLSFFA